MVGICYQRHGETHLLQFEDMAPLAKEALNLSSLDPNWYENSKADDRHAIAKLRSRLQIGTIIIRPTYEVNYYEIYEVEPDDHDSWLGRHIYGQNVLYYARPVHSRSLGNVREYWAKDTGIAFWLSDVVKEYAAYDGIPRDFVIAAKSYEEIEPHITEKFPSTDLTDRGMCDYLRKCGGWR